VLGPSPCVTVSTRPAFGTQRPAGEHVGLVLVEDALRTPGAVVPGQALLADLRRVALVRGDLDLREDELLVGAAVGAGDVIGLAVGLPVGEVNRVALLAAGGDLDLLVVAFAERLGALARDVGGVSLGPRRAREAAELVEEDHHDRARRERRGRRRPGEPDVHVVEGVAEDVERPAPVGLRHLAHEARTALEEGPHVVLREVLGEEPRRLDQEEVSGLLIDRVAEAVLEQLRLPHARRREERDPGDARV